MDFIKVILLIILVILIFNFVIFIHELGHFLAAKWRGMHADRFQIWFGKPIWKKKIGGVQYGLGWIPAGGFVSLPQMASMEGIEGSVDDDEKSNLKPAKPIDKIIVAFAGPLFSFLLAIFAACIVWVIGAPDDKMTSTTIGYVSETSPAKGLLFPGDKILEVEGDPVSYWRRSGVLSKTVTGNIVLSEGDTIEFKVLRDGKEVDVSTGFVLPDSGLLGRSYRMVGIAPEQQLFIAKTLDNSPAKLAGILPGDRILKVNGEKLYGASQLQDVLKTGEPLVVELLREGKVVSKKVVLHKPRGIDSYALGVEFDPTASELVVFNTLAYPNPVDQCKKHVGMMWKTISKVISPKTDIGVGHMNSFVGIADNYYQMLTMDHALNRILWFTVLLNVNLAILNLLPLPVLDGGHITTSLIEIIMRRPVPMKIMLVLQNAFVLLLLGLMLVLATKDFFTIGKRVGTNNEPQEIIFDLPKANEN